MSWLDEQLSKVSGAVGEKLETLGESTVAGIVGGIKGERADLTVGENAVGKPIVQKTPTGLGKKPKNATQPVGSTAAGLPGWVMPLGIGLAVAAAAGIAWKVWSA